MKKEHKKMIIDAILTPFSHLYGMCVSVRNKLFDWGVLRQHVFDTPVVSVGNVTVGGTGKTPHVEYLIGQLCSRYRIGVLSRGYKRQTKGFVLANDILSPKDLGDEPYQIYHKFGSLITLAVCEDRVKGIKEMLRVDPSINLIILDDAFQHRYVKPKVNIALVDFNRPLYDDRLLPLGRLREDPRGLRRSDMVIVTKCPANVSPIEKRVLMKGLETYLYAETVKNLFFSEFRYADPLPVFPQRSSMLHSMSLLSERDTVLAITGIAQPKTFVKYLKAYPAKVRVMHFDDHHYFTRRDFAYISDYFNRMQGERKFLLTTEKDAVRMLNNPYFPTDLRKYIYYIPIKVSFVDFENGDFMEKLMKLISQ